MSVSDVERVLRRDGVVLHHRRDRPAQSSPVRRSTAARDADQHHGRHPWHVSYRRAVLLTDAAALFTAVAAAELLRFGMDDVAAGTTQLTYTGLGLVIAVLWWIALRLYGATDPRILGHGPDEYRRVLHASVMMFGLVAIVSLLFKQDLSRGYLAIAFPAGVMGLVGGRWALRCWLTKRRRAGAMGTNVLVIGGTRSAQSIVDHFSSRPGAGVRVTGVWVPDAPEIGSRTLTDPRGARLAVLGNSTELTEAVRVADAGAVMVTDTEHLGGHGLRELAWELQHLHVDLMVSPNVVDVATPRIKLRTLGAMPFLHLEKPRYEGATRWGKVVFDKAFASAAIVGLAPLMAAAAIAVKLTSPGPVLYRSERIGVGGVPFEMLKFRSMVQGADQMRNELDSDTDGVLFKKKDDPRVTRVGAFMRRYSIDELPQFFNVLRGDMSVVGPRPPLRSEVEEYDEGVGRRLLVKQGLTGLWQVSGRSDLSWEATVRLDLDYVENWSLARDLHIIWKTARAVASRDGAY